MKEETEAVVEEVFPLAFEELSNTNLRDMRNVELIEIQVPSNFFISCLLKTFGYLIFLLSLFLIPY